jgi:predicted AAA+ superfamily ATPase
MSVLEASYLIHRLLARHPNIRKQVVKARKLHFFDTGLACYLRGCRLHRQGARC